MTEPALSPRAFRAGLALACVVFASLALGGAASDSITYDEGPFLHYGLLHLEGAAARKQVFNSKLPVTALHAAPVLLLERTAGIASTQLERDPRDEVADPGAHWRWKPSPIALAVGRAVAVAIGLALVLALALGARALAGDTAGLAAGLLAALEPDLLAHGHYVTADVPAALATLLLALATIRWARRGRARDGALAGACFGLALLAKFVLLVLAAVVPLALLARALVSRGEQEQPERARGLAWKRGLASLGAASLAALLVLNAGFFFHGFPGQLPERPRSERVAKLEGLIGRPPLPVPASWLEGLDWTLGDEERGASYGNLYLQGETQEDKRGFFRYYFVALAFKLPLPIFVLLALSLVRSLRGKQAESRLAAPDRAFLGTLALGFLLFLSFANRAQIGVRHALPIFPFIIIEASLALAALARGGPRARAKAAALVLWIAASVLSFAPDFLPYTNELIPRRTLAYRTFADSNLDWGQADSALLAWLEDERSAGRPVSLAGEDPVAGRLVVSVNALVGVSRPPRKLAWLRELRPVGHVRHAWLVFSVTEEEAARARASR
ncbi:glycosyltransferase family 39 protein [bacterium]|nr:glycosyltransferase family 39 protein [bacterium]